MSSVKTATVLQSMPYLVFLILYARKSHTGIKVSTIVPGVVRTNTVANALKGNGEPIGASEGVMEGGLSVTEAVLVRWNSLHRVKTK